MATFTAEQLDQMESAGGYEGTVAGTLGKTTFSAEELDAMEGGGGKSPNDWQLAKKALSDIGAADYLEKSLMGKAGGKAVEGLARLGGIDVPKKRKPPEDNRSAGEIALAAGKHMTANPLAFSVEMGKALLYDPWQIVLAQGLGPKLAATATLRMADALKAGQAARKVAQAGGALVGSVAEGAAVMGGTDVAHQLMDTGEVRGNQALGAALTGAVAVPALQGLIHGGKWLFKGRADTPAPEGQAATPTMDRFTETVGADGTTRDASKPLKYKKETLDPTLERQTDTPQKDNSLDVSAFLAERKAAPFEQQVRESIAQRFEDRKPQEIEAAWKQHKAEQARELELDKRRGDLAGIEDKLNRPLVNQKGAIDQTLLKTLGAAAAGTVAGLYAYARPDQQEDIAKAALGVGAILATKGRVIDALRPPSARALGPLLAEGKYTLPTLDRLPQNRTEFPVAMVEQQLKRPGVSAPERAIIEKALAEAKDGKITAEELVGAFRRETGDHTLLPKETETYSDYGVGRLGRTAEGDPMFGNVGDTFPELSTGKPVPATTTIWQLPENVTPSKYNHFGDPRYYGHTRSFVEDGKRHVVEIQSDLEANARGLTPEARAEAQVKLAEAEAAIRSFDKPLSASRDPAIHPDQASFKASKDQLYKLRQEATLRKQEAQLVLLRDKTAAGVVGSAGRAHEVAGFDQKLANIQKELEPIRQQLKELFKEQDTRAYNKETFDPVSEKKHNELMQKYHELRNTKELLKKARDEAAVDVGYKDLTPALKNSHRRLVREELGRAAAQGEPAVRFATADTVAKVEGWPTIVAERSRLLSVLLRAEEQIKAADGHYKNETNSFEVRQQAKREGFLAREQEAQAHASLEHLQRLREAGHVLVNTEKHQPIYNRYVGDTTKYLKSLGGKEVTDGTGNTWIEVPSGAGGKGGATEPRPFGGRPGQSGGPINMYGKIDSQLAITLGLTAAGVAIGGLVAGDEKLAGAILGGVTGAVAARLPGRFRAMNAALKVEPTKPRLNWKHHTSTAVRASAVVAGGAYLGDSWDNPVEGALFGAALVLGRAAMPKAKRLTTDEFFRLRNGNTASWRALTNNLKRDILDYIPAGLRREAITEALDTGTPSGLSQAERKVFGHVEAFTDQLGQEGLDVGVLKALRHNYITHIVERDPGVSVKQQATLFDEMFNTGAFSESSSPNSRFARSRKYDTISELNQALEGSGFRLKTKDIAEIVEIYGNAMRSAIENKRLIDSLKGAKDAAGQNYLQTQNKRGEIPEGFKRMQHPQLQGYGVHPELYDSMRTVFEHSDPNVISRGLFGLSQAIKRSSVYASLFHAKSLAEVYLLAAGASVLKGKRPLDVALKKYREMEMGDVTDLLIKQGMKIGIPDDVSTTIINSVGKAIDRGTNTKGGTAVTDKVDVVAKKLDYVTWDYMHSGVKLGIGHKEFITLMENNAKAHAKDPRVPLKSREEIAREVAGYVNDIAGGLDWYGIAADSQTALGRSVAMYFASPQGRRVAQMILFAPDWTVSTLRTAYKAFGRSETGLRGLWKPENATDLYRRYAIRSALYWITALNGLNYITAGHSIFENDDPTRLAFPDGTSMQAGKHTFEGVHAATEPLNFVYNKLGYLTKTPINLLLKHFNAGPMAYNNESMGEMLVKGALPFAVNSMLQKDLPPEERIKRAVVSSLGAPIYGYSDQQRRARALRRRKEAAAKRFEERRAR